MLDRRTFISGAAWSAAGISALGILDPSRSSAIAAELACHPGTATELACDENFWFEVQQAFTNDRSLVNLKQWWRQPITGYRAAGDETSPGLLQYGSAVHDVEDPGAAARAGARTTGAKLRMRCRRDCPDAQCIRRIADLPIRHRPATRRRDTYDDAGLWAHAHDVRPACEARGVVVEAISDTDTS